MITTVRDKDKFVVLHQVNGSVCDLLGFEERKYAEAHAVQRSVFAKSDAERWEKEGVADKNRASVLLFEVKSHATYGKPKSAPKQ